MHWSYIWHPKLRPHSHFSLRCHQHNRLHRHHLKDPLHLNDLLQPLPSHTPPRHHLPCRKSTKAILSAPARSQLCPSGNLTWISTIPAKPMESTFRLYTVRSSKFSQYKDIEGMDPLQIPLWKFLYQGWNNTWLRRIAHGRDVFVLPFDNIGTTVFVAELVQQLKARNLDLNRLAAFRTRQQGTQLQQKEATQYMAKEIAQLMQSWLPTPTAPDPTSQQRILDLEAQLAALKGQQSTDNPLAPLRRVLRRQHRSSSPSRVRILLLLPSRQAPCSSCLAPPILGWKQTRSPVCRKPPTRSGSKIFSYLNPKRISWNVTSLRQWIGGANNWIPLAIKFNEFWWAWGCIRVR